MKEKIAKQCNWKSKNKTCDWNGSLNTNCSTYKTEGQKQIVQLLQIEKLELQKPIITVACFPNLTNNLTSFQLPRVQSSNHNLG